MTATINLTPNWCKGCGICFTLCSQKVLGPGPDLRCQVVHPEKCTGCRQCELHCPDYAIDIERGSSREHGK
ncbi:MAG: 4Fe-4S binding protein [Heliobacteriaceae bacterium]|nr:4Fe-4S binding protein [Heliobacteriaceae bacterium]MDD4587523.1 4Fe-4S binding protein [Heliobacteriaceae bacterium]